MRRCELEVVGRDNLQSPTTTCVLSKEPSTEEVQKTYSPKQQQPQQPTNDPYLEEIREREKQEGQEETE